MAVKAGGRIHHECSPPWYCIIYIKVKRESLFAVIIV